jgi:glyoxylase-like metal-dependent hydrolase (beta-lactamase superfamily II)
VTAIPFVRLDDPAYGAAVDVSPMIRRVIANNPSKYTYHGTGTYIVGRGEVAVIDPGPNLDSHRDALRAALAGERVTAIIVTHCHADHSPLAAWLSEWSGAPTIGFGPHGEVGPLEEDTKLEESIDVDFTPDVAVVDGEVMATGPGWTLRAVHTPGHTSNHLCVSLAEESALFTGDHVMGWSTTVVSPPDGDMAAYIESLHKVAGRRDDVLWPTHGTSIDRPTEFLAAYVHHRLQRESAVLAAVRAGTTRIEDIVRLLYAEVREELHKPAGRSVLAHLVKLCDEGRVEAVTPPGHGEQRQRPWLDSVFNPV